MDHLNLTQHERKIVNENVGRLGAQLLRERVDQSRWAQVVLAVVIELAGQILRLSEGVEVNDTERPPAPAPE